MNDAEKVLKHIKDSKLDIIAYSIFMETRYYNPITEDNRIHYPTEIKDIVRLDNRKVITLINGIKIEYLFNDQTVHHSFGSSVFGKLEYFYNEESVFELSLIHNLNSPYSDYKLSRIEKCFRGAWEQDLTTFFKIIESFKNEQRRLKHQEQEDIKNKNFK